MSPQKTVLGVMKPVGGGDPVPLTKPEVTIGRRPSCDVQLDFENVSGKHCRLRFVNAVWHVRDLGSTNGTKLNGAALSSEHMVMPDDELGIASHVFTIDYEPGGPTAASHNEGYGDPKRASAVPDRLSLLELADWRVTTTAPDPGSPAPRRRPTSSNGSTPRSTTSPTPSPRRSRPSPPRSRTRPTTTSSGSSRKTSPRRRQARGRNSRRRGHARTSELADVAP